MKNNRRAMTRRASKNYRCTSLRLPEALEAKLPLDASGFAGNDCAPDLDLSNVAIQTAIAGQEFSFDMFNAGAIVTDSNADNTPTNDNIILQLDPDDNPGEASLTAAGQFTWTPPADATGRFEFIVIAIDAGTPALADAETFVVEIPTPNSAPDLADIADVTAAVGTEVVVTLTATDTVGSNLTFQIDPETQNLQTLGATLEQNGSTATLRWTPDSTFAGQSIDFIALVVDDGTPPMSDSERFTITVGNEVVATADTYSVSSGSNLVVDAANGVLANDGTGGAASLTVSIVDQASNGTVVLAADGSFTYTPDAGFGGSDTFTYLADDGNGNTAQGTVTINVNSAPVAANDAYTTDEDTVLTIGAGTGVLSNDSDSDGDVFTATIAQSPASGSVVLNDDGSFEYTPAADVNGDVTFTYIIDDGALSSSEATVTISISPVNDVPTAVDESYDATEETSLGVAIIDGVLANDTDVDGDTLSAALVTDVANGTLTLNNDGSFTYLPNTGFSGPDTFTYTVTDGVATSVEATATINVGNLNDPPIAAIDEYTIAEGSTLVVDAENGVLANDTDDDGDTLTASLGSQPFKGSISFNPDGSFEYTPDPGESGLDTFVYRANDGSVDSNVATVSINITNVNEAPVGVDDAYTINEDEVFNADASTGVLANDTDADGDTLTVTIVDEPNEGTVTLNADGSFEYQAVENSSGADTFTYQISDGTTTSAVVTVALTINTMNDAPVAVNDSYDVAFDQSLTIAAPGVLANDMDAEGATLTASILTGPTNGTVDLQSDGSFSYQPDAGYTGDDSFTYQISDGDATGDGTVNIRVTGSNEFSVSEAAAVGAVVGTVVPMTSTPAVYQFAQPNLNTELILDETDHLSGGLSAPVVLIEYLDFGCPHCKDAHPVIEQLKQDYPDDLLVVQRHFPVITTNSPAAARVAEAAAEQNTATENKFEQMVQVLFDNQAEWTALADPSAKFNEYAQQIGLDMTQFAADIGDPDLVARVTDDQDSAIALSLNSTPSYFLDGVKLDPAPTDLDGFKAQVQPEIDTAPGSFAINRKTGEITVRDNSNLTSDTLTVLVTDAQGGVESIPVSINTQSASASGVASSGLDDALASELDWLA